MIRDGRSLGEGWSCPCGCAALRTASQGVLLARNGRAEAELGANAQLQTGGPDINIACALRPAGRTCASCSGSWPALRSTSPWRWSASSGG